MKAIILAAGNARRLLPQTEHIPKTLLHVGPQHIIEHILDSVRSENITDVVVVTGHGKEHLHTLIDEYTARFPEMHITTVNNPEFDTAGNVVSLHSAREHFSDDVIIINSDTIFATSILHDVIHSSAPHAFAVDNEKLLSEEEMKVILNAEGHVTRIHKSIAPGEAHGEYIGVMKIGKEAAKHITDALEKTIAENNSLYYEDALQRSIDEHRIHYVAINTNGRPAMEIDTPQDLAEAEQLIIEICPS